MLEPIGDELWLLERQLRFLGVECGSRTTIVRLRGGGLLVHSPAPLSPALRAEVDALGPVSAIVAPSRFHHLGVGSWIEAYPQALVCGCPGLAKKRPDLRWDRVLGDAPEPLWAGELEQVYFGARTMEHEVVFFHPGSRTMICADIVFNLARHPSRLTRAVARMLGQREPGATWLEHLMMRDRAAAREQIGRMLAWDIDRIVLSHGPLIERGGREVLRRAYAWL
jgi:glyoxylase-like metal-dependent hydrolase (beta-lactamase superfamily II)